MPHPAIHLSSQEITAIAASVAALAAVIGAIVATANTRKSIEALEIPFLIPHLTVKDQWRLHFEETATATALRVPMHNVGRGPAIMGDVQLMVRGRQFLSQAGGQIPFPSGGQQSLPLQYFDQPPEPGQEGELRIYYTHASGRKYMTRCHVKIDQVGVLPTSFLRERSDGAERKFLFQSEPTT